MAVVSSQPGVGKTTVAVNLAASLFKGGYPTLLIDLAAPADASRALGVQATDGLRSAYAVLTGMATVPDTRLPTASGIDLVPGHSDLAGLEHRRSDLNANALREAVAEVAQDYAFIFLDCPSGDGQLTRCAAFVARHLLIPYLPESRQGVPAALSTFIAQTSRQWTVSVVANRVSLQATTSPAPRRLTVAGRTVTHLGTVRTSDAFREANRQGLPPASRGAENDTAALDFVRLAAMLTGDRDDQAGEPAAAS
jgi:cellulose biosynthesis protein BcsQ